MAYIYVANCDETTAKCSQLGGKTLMPPMNIEKVGRMSILADPQGAVFSAFTPEGPPA
jgi:predicted enzyme related to lactoylglutathione lyase